MHHLFLYKIIQILENKLILLWINTVFKLKMGSKGIKIHCIESRLMGIK